MIFQGRHDREIFKEYGHWLMYITDIYLPCMDSENGDLRFLPFPGSVFDQPYMSMQVIKIIQGVYRKFLVDRQKAMQEKARRGQIVRRR